MVEILKTLRDTPLPSILVIGGLVFLLLPFLKKTGGAIEIETSNKIGAAFIGMVLLTSGIGLYLLPTVPAVSSMTDVPAIQSTVVSPTASLQAYTLTQTIASQSSGGYIPKSPEEAAALFGGPPASAWKQCPGEPLGCWTFALPGASFQIKVPENCLRPDGSIDGWRYEGGYPGMPDEIQGTIRIWKSLAGATIRCH
ncbi:MAG: hypothetical protein QXS54_07890 [Candidatus Methanomethylicaceae archaeon]